MIIAIMTIQIAVVDDEDLDGEVENDDSVVGDCVCDGFIVGGLVKGIFVEDFVGDLDFILSGSLDGS